MIVDAHVHFWDPGKLRYAWLSGLDTLRRPFLPAEYAASAGLCADRLVFVEANCDAQQNVAEVEYVERLVASEPRIAAIVAFVDLTSCDRLDDRLSELASHPLVRGVRHNIQGEPSGFCLHSSFVGGVRAAGRRGLSFDLCVTHDQLGDALTLVRSCPGTMFVLDHCGKPAIRNASLEPWRSNVAALAGCPNVYCKLSGLLTETDPARGRDEDLLPYATAVIGAFGAERLMYGSDWPVLTLAGDHRRWSAFIDRVTDNWSKVDRERFLGGTAAEVYRL